MDNFYKITNCSRCGINFTNDVKRLQSWFNDDVICSLTCNDEEKNIIKILGERKYEFEDYEHLPSLEFVQKILNNSKVECEIIKSIIPSDLL